MDRLVADFRELSKLDIPKLAKPIGVAKARRPFAPAERTAFDAAAAFAKLVDPSAGVLSELSALATTPPRISLFLPPALSPPSADLTVGIGGTFQAFAGISIILELGVYGSTTGEIGTFSTIGSGIFIGGGFSGGISVAVVFGKPPDFAGNFAAIAVDVSSSPGFGLGVGGALLFTLKPLKFMGYSFSVSAGFTGLPVTVSLQLTGTAIKPRLNLSL